MKKYYSLIIMGLLLFSHPEKLRANPNCLADCGMGYWSCSPICEHLWGQKHGFCKEICSAFYEACTYSGLHHQYSCTHACNKGTNQCIRTCENLTAKDYIDCQHICGGASNGCIGRHPGVVSSGQENIPLKKPLPHPK